MSNTTNANSINYKDKGQKKEVAILILAYFVFKSKSSIVDRIIDKFKILPLGHNAKFKKLAEEWKRNNSYDGKVITKIYYPDETSKESLINCVTLLKGYAQHKSNNDRVKVDIKIFVPEHSVASLNTVFTRYLFGKLEPSQDINTWKSILGEKVEFEDNNIKILDYSEMPLVDVKVALKDNLDDATSDDVDMPTSKEARVAAVLCEYAYYLVRDYNYNHKNGSKFLGEILLRNKSDETRSDNTLKEICGLDIVPKRWKPKSQGSDENETSNELIEKLGLEDWDAIAFDYKDKNSKHWLGLSKHEIDWDSSLSKAIIDSLNKKFSLIGNSGILNTWFGLTKNSGFASVIYVNEKLRTVMYCTAGSDFGADMLFNGDWMTTNMSQFLTGLSPQYQQSVTNAKILNDIIDKINKDDDNKDKKPVKLLFIGHSLGGGLASNNAIVTSNRHAITFNAAGLNWLRVPISLTVNNPRQLLHPFKRKERVHLFVIKGEILDSGQSVISPTPWILNDLNLDLPGKARAYSASTTRKEIEAPFIDGEQPNSLGRHSMVNFMKPASRILQIEI